jgi:hypothetical protein
VDIMDEYSGPDSAPQFWLLERNVGRCSGAQGFKGEISSDLWPFIFFRTIMKAFARKFSSLISRKRLQYPTGRGSEGGVFSKHVDHVRLALLTAGLLILAG